MKFIITITLALVFSIQFSYAQNIKAPEKAVTHFKNEFNPIGEHEVSWSFEEGMYVANYIRNEKKRHAYYSSEGMFLLDKIEVPFERLNPEVKKYVEEKLKPSSVLVNYEVLSNKAPEHNQILIEENGKKYLLTFTPEGKFHFKKELIED